MAQSSQVKPSTQPTSSPQVAEQVPVANTHVSESPQSSWVSQVWGGAWTQPAPQSAHAGQLEVAQPSHRRPAPHVPSSRRRRGDKVEGMSREELERLVITLEEEMFQAAEELRFEYAAKLRDEIKELRRDLDALAEAPA